jgi:hypothetical protein
MSVKNSDELCNRTDTKKTTNVGPAVRCRMTHTAYTIGIKQQLRGGQDMAKSGRPRRGIEDRFHVRQKEFCPYRPERLWGTPRPPSGRVCSCLEGTMVEA